jgi:type I restriction enzyme S subunit
MQGAVPYWGANGIVDRVERSLFNEELVLLGEDGAPFDNPYAAVAFLVSEPVWVNNHIHVLRPRLDTEARYLNYALNTVDWMLHVSGSTRLKLTQDDMMRALVPVWPPEEQRSIADFLDTETARIDALITKKRRMIELLEERAGVVRANTFSNLGRWRLKRVLRAPMAYGVLVPQFVDTAVGVPMARIGSLTADGTVASDRLTFVDPAQGLEFRRTKADVGDLVLSVVGSMGRSAVVDASSAGINMNRALARLQPIPDLPTRLLWHWTQTRLFMDQALLATGGGTAQPTLNLGALAEFDVGLTDDRSAWGDVLEKLESQLAPITAISVPLHAQLALLQEHRQALITAAVTGELDLPGAAA